MGAQQHPTPPHGLSGRSGPRTILVADDSATIRKIVELTFGGTTIRVDAAATGAEALDRLESGVHDLVLADVAMPGPAGYELCRRIKTSARPVPVLLLTGAFDALDEERAARCGADGHVGKPFESEALIERVRDLLEASAGPSGAEAGGTAGPGPLSTAAVEQVARAVLARLTDRVVREVVRDTLPDIAERVVRERIAELERSDDRDPGPDPDARGAVE